jgi:hypothetical protein
VVIAPRDENSSPFARSGGAADATAAGRDRQVVSEEVVAGATAAVCDIFPSLYKAGKFLGTFGCVMTHFNGRWYKSKINGKMYRVTILDPALA